VTVDLRTGVSVIRSTTDTGARWFSD